MHYLSGSILKASQRQFEVIDRMLDIWPLNRVKLALNHASKYSIRFISSDERNT